MLAVFNRIPEDNGSLKCTRKELFQDCPGSQTRGGPGYPDNEIIIEFLLLEIFREFV